MKIPKPPHLAGFRSEKAAQAAAVFINTEGGRMDKLKLIKLLYLAERESISERGRPIFYDEFYSLVHGPICSNSLDALNRKRDEDLWAPYIHVADKKNIQSSKRKKSTEMDQFSDSDRKVLNAVWKQFGRLTTPEIYKWVHTKCPEYVEVAEGESLPIRYSDIYKALGFDHPEDMESHIQEYRSAEAELARIL